VFLNDKNPVDSFRRQLGIAKARHWIAEGPCSLECHGEHLWLTEAGTEALRLMNERGCCAACEHVAHGAALRLEKKVA
jgi:hypothetical protein